MQSIPTKYNGYLFRSRLEARWAVFFDQLGIEYEYEPEGFAFYDGTWYLPDFYLPDFHCYFEVKRKGVKNTSEGEEAIRKISKFDGMFGDGGIITFGDPVDNDCLLFCCAFEKKAGCYATEVQCSISSKNFSEKPSFLLKDKNDEWLLDYCTFSIMNFSNHARNFDIPFIKAKEEDYCKVVNAGYMARQADF